MNLLCKLFGHNWIGPKYSRKCKRCGFIENQTFDSEWLEKHGFYHNDQYTYTRGYYSIVFTKAGCDLLHNGIFVQNFNGYIDDLKEVWLKYTGEKL